MHPREIAASAPPSPSYLRRSALKTFETQTVQIFDTWQSSPRRQRPSQCVQTLLTYFDEDQQQREIEP